MTEFHALSNKDLLTKLKSTEAGLSKKEATKRLESYGPNEIIRVGGTRWYQLIAAQFTNIMVLILIVAGAVSLFVGEHIDAIAIAVIIALNAVIGFIQEYKAEKAVEALQDMAAPHALVIRNKETLKIPAQKLVPGDIIVLEEGMRVPADARVLSATQMEAIEASLTGESHPSKKTEELVTEFDSIGDLHNSVFMGTVISQGHGLAVVTHTGMQTEFGKIAHMVQSEESSPTPLQRQLDRLSRVLALIVLGIVGFLFLIALVSGKDLLEIFLLSVSLAVSVIPEGLPAIITLTLAIGVQQIAKHNAIIRKLPAAETLGSTSVICSDKTGTLTQNQMTVQLIHVNGQDQAVSGLGYAPKGDIEGTSSAEQTLLLEAAALCNNAKLLQHKNRWDIAGDPTEACLLTLARKGGLDLHKLDKEWPRKEELVFDSNRKRMSTLNKDRMFSKGAPDSMLEVCSHIQINGKVERLSAKDKAAIMKKNDELAQKAYRVLGFAYKEVNKAKDFTEENMVFIGLAAMMDPPRKEVKAAIAKCKSAHIEVVMITGDHALTARAVGEAIGLYEKGDKVLTGAELEELSETQLKKIVEKVRIYARVSPKHKVRILKALQAKGHIVAMTGDGVNDAPALKSADIGVAMGITGTDVSKEASSMVLVDDNFATIVATVESGRVIYRNIKKFIRFLLSANFDAVIVISVAALFGLPLPFVPLQILWVNLLTDAFPAIALGVDVPEKDIMQLKPRDPKASLWRQLIKFSLISGVLASIISLFIYFRDLGVNSIEHTRTLMFTTLVIFELMLVFSVRSATHHYFTNFFKNKFLILAVLLSLGLQLAAIYHPWLQKVLQTEALGSEDWLWILSLCAACMVIIEIWKRFRKKPTHV